MPNLGLGYLASILRNQGHEVKLLNCMQAGMNFKVLEDIPNADFAFSGCPFSYNFCAGKCITGKKVRKRSIEK